jgi:hypothetical protein
VDKRIAGSVVDVAAVPHLHDEDDEAFLAGFDDDPVITHAGPATPARTRPMKTTREADCIVGSYNSLIQESQNSLSGCSIEPTKLLYGGRQDFNGPAQSAS